MRATQPAAAVPERRDFPPNSDFPFRNGTAIFFVTLLGVLATLRAIGII